MSRRFRLLLGLVVVLAVSLRAWHLAADLPDFLEEALPFRKALELWGAPGGPPGWNPHSFVYPSLTIYLHLLVQKLGCWVALGRGAVGSAADWRLLASVDPTAAVLPARALHVLFDGVTVALAGMLAERLRRGAGLPAALVTALGPTLIGTSRLILTDTVMTAFALAALERMLAWRERGGARRLAAAAVLTGLAAGSKYPGIVALVPLAWLAWDRAGARGVRLWLAAALGALAVFVLTTPYALLDLRAFGHDLVIHGLHATGGHLGQSARGTLGSYLRQLLGDLGPFGLLLVVVSLALVGARSTMRTGVLAVWLFLLAFFVPTALARFASAHYLAPVVPAAAVLAAVAAFELPGRLAPTGRRLTTSALTVLLLLPPLVTGVRAAAAGGRFTQIEARRWLEARLAPTDLVMAEAWGPRVRSWTEAARVRSDPWFAAASADARRRVLGACRLHVVELPLTVAGRVASRLTASDGARVELAVFPSALELNGIAYDPRLFAGAEWVVTSGAVRGRFEAEPSRFAAACRLYRLLDSTATVAARFEARAGVAGPDIVVYRIGPRARAALAAAGPLPPLWWAEPIPERYRREATMLLGSSWEGGAPLRGDGTAALWVRSLATVYRSALQPFALDLAANLADLDRCDAARPLLEGTLLVLRDPATLTLYEQCTAGARGRAAL